ncbi:MAG: hypothetical protein PUP46_08170, partial [Endozoicomonas sp. (ex Botrylloides leachii)]|nr:hypothetical protein [Endozoicomonas sp. (ex Botrylloides leachii)]
ATRSSKFTSSDWLIICIPKQVYFESILSKKQLPFKLCNSPDLGSHSKNPMYLGRSHLAVVGRIIFLCTTTSVVFLLI